VRLTNARIIIIIIIIMIRLGVSNRMPRQRLTYRQL